MTVELQIGLYIQATSADGWFDQFLVERPTHSPIG